MNDHIPQSLDSQSKVCTRCKTVRPLTEFYRRSGYPNQWLSECKVCMKQRSQNHVPLPPTEPRAKTEILAINELRRNGIHAAPGKSVKHSDVDVVAFGCVNIEIKYSRLERSYSADRYTFGVTPAQIRRGFLADLVMLICDNNGRLSFHLFRADFPAFYMKGRLKKGFDFLPGRLKNMKPSSDRVVLTQPMMDEAENRWSLIWATLKAKSDALKQESA